MSFLYKSLNGLDPIGAGEVQDTFNLPMLTLGGMGLLSWGNLVDTVRAPLLARIEALELNGGGGGEGGGAGGPSIWPSARTLTLAGAVTGSVSMDGSQNVSMTTSIADGSLTMAKVSGLSGAISDLQTRVTGTWTTGYTTGPQPTSYGGNLNSLQGAVFVQTEAGTSNLPSAEGVNTFTILQNGPINFGNQQALRAGEMWLRGQAFGAWDNWYKVWTSKDLDPSLLLLKSETATQATKLATTRAFSLTGVVTAPSVNFDGTGAVALSTSIADNALSIAKVSGLQTALTGRLAHMGELGEQALNAVTTPGIYRQTNVGLATLARNYPNASSVGQLVVTGESSYIVQTYTSTTNVQWRRIHSSSNWGAWVRIYSTADFDPANKYDKAGGAIGGNVTIAGTLGVSQSITVPSLNLTTTVAGEGDPAWLIQAPRSHGDLSGLRATASALELVNTAANGTIYALGIHEDGELRFRGQRVFHEHNFNPAEPVPTSGVLTIGASGGTRLLLRQDGQYSTDGGTTWRQFNEDGDVVTDPRYNTLELGSAGNIRLEESPTGRLSLRTGTPSNYFFFHFAGNGNFAVPGRIFAEVDKEVWHTGNFTPSSKLDATATAVAAVKLAAARTINGVPFDGTSNITIASSPGVNPTLEGTTNFDVDNGSTARLLIRANGSDGVTIDGVNAENSAFAPLSLRGSSVTINDQVVWTAANFNPATKLDSRESLGVAAAVTTNWNDAISNGWYMAAAALNAPTGASGNWLMGVVSHHNAGWVQQEVWMLTDSPATKRWRRHKLNEVWSDWTDVVGFGQVNVERSVYAHMEGRGAATSAFFANAPANQQTGAFAILWAGQRIWQMGVEDTGDFKFWAYNNEGVYQSNPVTISREGNVGIGGSPVSGIDSRLSVAGGIKSYGGMSMLGVFERDSSDSVQWALYAQAGLFRVWRSGTGDLMTVDSSGSLVSSRISAGWDSGMTGAISCSNWFRTTGQTGLYFSDYNGGWYMTDADYVRSYNDKPVAASDFVLSSDSRLKSNIRNFEYRGRLRPVMFTMKETGKDEMGFVADDIECQYPEAVGWIRAEHGPLKGEMIRQLSQGKLTAVLSHQVNQVEDRTEVLTSEVEALKAELQQLKQLVADLMRSQ